MRHTLKKHEILRGKKKFDLLFEHGKRIQGTVTRCLTLYHPCIPGETPTVTVAFVIPRTVKRAVDRIRIKRLLREAYRKNKHELLQHQSHNSIMLLFMFVQRAASQRGLPSYEKIENDMKSFLRAVSKKSLS